MASGSGTREDAWQLTTANGGSQDGLAELGHNPRSNRMKAT
jgi:hypothetical protein